MGKQREITKQDLLVLKKDYKRGTCPGDPKRITVQVDPFEGGVKAVKTAFAENGDIYVIDWVICNLLDLNNFLQEPVDCESEIIRCGCTGLISDGFNTLNIRKFCSKSEGYFYPVKSRNFTGNGDTIGMFLYEMDGRKFGYNISDPFYNAALNTLILNDENERKIFFPIDTDDDFFSELMCNKLSKVKNKLSKERYVWQITGPNYYWDCCKYAVALNEWLEREPLH